MINVWDIFPVVTRLPMMFMSTDILFEKKQI